MLKRESSGTGGRLLLGVLVPDPGLVGDMGGAKGGADASPADLARRAGKRAGLGLVVVEDAAVDILQVHGRLEVEGVVQSGKRAPASTSASLGLGLCLVIAESVEGCHVGFLRGAGRSGVGGRKNSGGGGRNRKASSLSITVFAMMTKGRTKKQQPNQSAISPQYIPGNPIEGGGGEREGV